MSVSAAAPIAGFCQRLQRLIEDANVGAWHLHVPSGLFTTNEAFQRLTGLSRAELGDSMACPALARRIHPADLNHVQQACAQAAAGEFTGDWVDFRVQLADAAWRSLRMRLSILERDGADKPVHVSALVLDVSAEKELGRRMRAVFDRPFQFIGLLSADGVLLETNRSSLEQSGHRSEEVLNRHFWDSPFFRDSPELRTRLRDGIHRAAAGEFVRFDMQHPDKEGNQVTVDFTLTPLRDDAGKVINIIPEGRDISEVVRTREALRTSEGRLAVAMQGANLGLWDMNCHDGNHEIWHSDQWYAQLGYEPGDLQMDKDLFRRLCHPDDLVQLDETWREHVEGRAPECRAEFRMRAKDGTWRWILSTGRVVERTEHGEVRRIAGIIIDVTEKKMLEQQLASAQRLETIGQLAAGVAHEINTPVQYVSDSLHFVREGVAELLATSAGQQPPGAATNTDLQYLRDNLPAALDRAVTGLERIGEIVRSMKEFSHPDQRQLGPIDLNRTIQNTLVVARNEYKYVADVEASLAELPPVICHGGEISQVLLNLLVNAAHAIADVVKDSGDKGRITIATQVENDQAVISISDTGTGIPESARERIFEPFFTTKEVGKGTGQGLAIVYNVVRSHGGSVSFQTNIGQGTTFFVRLPLTQSAEIVTPAAA